MPGLDPGIPRGGSTSAMCRDREFFSTLLGGQLLRRLAYIECRRAFPPEAPTFPEPLRAAPE